MSISTTPTYNIKVVLNKTGIAADTLRAWERRYGLPNPQRTPGGHRLYSDYDIATIKWLMARQAEGLSISRAVDLWNEQIASGLDPLERSGAASLPGLASSASISPLAVPSPASTLVSLRADWIQACKEFDELAAEQILNQAFSLFPVEAVCMDLLQKGLSEIGELWYENKLSVQQEHFASALAMRRLDALLSAAPAPTRKGTALIGCVAEEWHTFTPLLLALLLRRRGWHVIYLGANVPNDRFAETAETVGADLVILVAQTLVTAASLQLAAQTLAVQNVRVAYGGRIFNLHPSLREKIPAHFLGESIEASAHEAERLLQSKTLKVSEPLRVSEAHLAAHQFFTAHRAEIELTLKQLVPPLAVSPSGLESGIQHLGDNIAAALQLGDMGYVSGEMEWLKTLMQAHSRPASELIHFMQSYAEAVDRHINGAGEPIKRWLAEEIAKLQ
ncbi:MAG TPA: B12-binding domain-containing protein [Anaerolineales bacterium]|nr:B12-binding domain-containing protein [Anaerolineales bacterium]